MNPSERLACLYARRVGMPKYHPSDDGQKYLCTYGSSAEAIISCPFAIDDAGPPADCPQLWTGGRKTEVTPSKQD